MSECPTHQQIEIQSVYIIVAMDENKLAYSLSNPHLQIKLVDKEETRKQYGTQVYSETTALMDIVQENRVRMIEDKEEIRVWEKGGKWLL